MVQRVQEQLAILDHCNLRWGMGKDTCVAHVHGERKKGYARVVAFVGGTCRGRAHGAAIRVVGACEWEGVAVAKRSGMRSGEAGVEYSEGKILPAVNAGTLLLVRISSQKMRKQGLRKAKARRKQDEAGHMFRN